MVNRFELLKNGKGKIVYSTSDPRTILVQYKDSITGHSVESPDPGGNQAIGETAGTGRKCLSITLALFDLLGSAGIPVADMKRLDHNQAYVETLSLVPIEVICRNRSTGSFSRRYGNYVSEGQNLAGMIEFTLKDDLLGDPLITEEALNTLRVVNHDDVCSMKSCTISVNKIL